MKNRSIILNIKKPCAENWEGMSTSEKGKFCSHCQKTVIDVSHYNDQQLATFLAAQKESICLRALTTQTDRPLKQTITAPSPIYRAAAAIGFSILLIAGADSFAKAPFRPATSFINEEDKEGFMQSADSVLLQGKVVDSFSKPISNVALKIWSDSVLLASLMSDTEGCFSIWISKKLIVEEKLFMQTEHLSFQDSRLWLTKELTEQANSILLRLEPKLVSSQIIPVTNIITETRYTMGATPYIYTEQPIIINPKKNYFKVYKKRKVHKKK